MLASRLILAPPALLVVALAASPPAVSGEAAPGPTREETKNSPAPDGAPQTPPSRTPSGSDEKAGAAAPAEEVPTPFEAAERNNENRRRERARAVEQVPAPLPYWPYGWGWHPWYGIPQTYYAKDYYPPSITHVPRLGLQHNYPFAYQMGLRIPDDSDPLTEEHSPANLGPFVGFIGALREIAAAESGADDAISLIREKKYREAGRMLAEGYRESDDPRYPVLLAEVFFLLGKYDHAEALLEQALSMEDAERALPEDVSAHLASPDELSSRLAEVGDKPRLITAYMLLHSKEPGRGVDMLNRLSRDGSKPAAVLYRRYVAKAL